MKENLTGSLSVALLALVACGCVPYETYDGVRAEYEHVRKAHEDLRAKYAMLLQEFKRDRGAGMLTDIERQNYEQRLQSKDQTIADLQKKLSERPNLQFDPSKIDIPGVEHEEGHLILGEALLFNSGEASIKKSGQRALDRLADVLKREYPGQVFHIVGHTDNVPLNRTKRLYETNLNLGWQRAYAVFNYLRLKHGFDEDQFVLHSYGFTDPTDPQTADTPEGRAKNRRVEIYRGGFKF